MIQRIVADIQAVSISAAIPWERLSAGLIILIVGIVVVRILARVSVRMLAKGLKSASRELIRKVLVYIGSILVLILVLNAAGVSLGALLGAAGVVGIAIGIASQAGISNIVSGLFLLSERFFDLGDVITVGGRTGVVYSIDLLSIRVKTFDNTLIRIANQELISRDIVNITRFPIRRMDFSLTLDHAVSVETAILALQSVPSRVEAALEVPEAFVLFGGFTDRGLEMRLGVWFQRDDYIAVRNGIGTALQAALSEAQIDIVTTRITVIDDRKQEQRGVT